MAMKTPLFLAHQHYIAEHGQPPDADDNARYWHWIARWLDKYALEATVRAARSPVDDQIRDASPETAPVVAPSTGAFFLSMIDTNDLGAVQELGCGDQ